MLIECTLTHNEKPKKQMESKTLTQDYRLEIKMAKRGATSEAPKLLPDDMQEIMEMDKIIPWFVWQRLKAKIHELPWVNVSNACKNLEPNHKAEASGLYNAMMKEIDFFIEKESKLQGSSWSNSVQMSIEKKNIEEKYQKDPVAFVQAMADCLQREHCLHFLGHKSPSHIQNSPRQQSPKHEAMAAEETLQEETQLVLNSIEYIEQLVQSAREHIHNFNKLDSDVKHLSVGWIGKGTNPDERLAFAELKISEADSIRFEEITHNRCEALRSAISDLQELCTNCELSLHFLETKINHWREAEKLANVHIGPETVFDDQIFARFVAVLNTVTMWFTRAQTAAAASPSSSHTLPELDLLGPLRSAEVQEVDQMIPQTAVVEDKMKKIEAAYIERTLIVSQQPPEMVAVEKQEKSNASKSGSSAEAKTKETKEKKKKGGSVKTYSSKKAQKFETKIKIPGGNEFSSLFFTNLRIECVLESELAAQSRSPKDTRAETDTETSGKSQLHWERSPQTMPDEFGFKDIWISNHSRLSSNEVHKEFVRIRFSATVVVNSREYDVQVLSLPFLFNTGSNQLLSFIGTRLWYFGSSSDMYHGNFQCPEELPEKVVLDLLNKCVRHVHERGRELRFEEQVYLSELLPKNGAGMVNLQDFIGTKPFRVPDNFFTWFYAVVNTIKTLWLELWLDGSIYGFISKAKAEELLSSKSNPYGATILRPTINELEKTSSTNALAALVMQTKNKGTDPHTKEPTIELILARLSSDYIKLSGFFKAVTRVYYEEDGVKKSYAEYLLGYNLKKRIDYLKKYGKGAEPEINKEYSSQVEKHLYLKLTPFSDQQKMTQASGKGEAMKKDGSSRAKKSRGRRTGSRTSETSATTLGDSSISSTPSPSEEAFAVMEGKGTVSPSEKLKTNPISSDQGQASGTWMDTADPLNEPKGMNHAGPGGEAGKFKPFNGVQIDTSRLSELNINDLCSKSLKGESNNMSPTSGWETMSPLSGSQSMSPPNYMSPKNEPKAVSPVAVSSDMSGFSILQPMCQTGSLVAMGDVACASPAHYFLKTNQSETTNLPTVLEDARYQSSRPSQTRRSYKGKQTGSARVKKLQEGESMFAGAQVLNKIPSSIQQTSSNQVQAMANQNIVYGQTAVTHPTPSYASQLSQQQDFLNGPLAFQLQDAQASQVTEAAFPSGVQLEPTWDEQLRKPVFLVKQGSQLLANAFLNEGEGLQEMFEYEETNPQDSGIYSLSPTTQSEPFIFSGNVQNP
ncbi:signal transducer and activator of transcription [Plakobranchus ocellatus]|uniref:Signal transducer and activator of transcription n=1 Tax=Plakobranchus ocellatus TaxID=259542 RepID=A0AAV3XRR0_9GAST|nr:signal transducer and activator of transcription [Plakobranchus ocellatus]